MNPELNEQYRKLINELYAQALSERGDDLPKVDVNRQVKPTVQKRIPTNNPTIAAAIAQTQNDVNDFKANRALGDREMLASAMENGYNFHFGGPNNIQTPLPVAGGFRRSTVEDNAYPTGRLGQIPNYQTNRQRPEDIQRQMEEERDRLFLEGIEELKKKRAIYS